MSLGVNRLASSTTWVDSALWGSQADASFCWALLSLPASGPATANTATQKTSTAHLPQRPLGMLANLRARFMTLPHGMRSEVCLGARYGGEGAAPSPEGAHLRCILGSRAPAPGCTNVLSEVQTCRS